MQIQINTDRNIEGHEARTDNITGIVKQGLGHFEEHLTRVEVHLSDQNSQAKGGNEDHRCLMEGRIAGRAPIAVTHHAATLVQAAEGAVHKLARRLDSTLGRLRDQRTHSSNAQASPDADAPST